MITQETTDKKAGAPLRVRLSIDASLAEVQLIQSALGADWSAHFWSLHHLIRSATGAAQALRHSDAKHAESISACVTGVGPVYRWLSDQRFAQEEGRV